MKAVFFILFLALALAGCQSNKPAEKPNVVRDTVYVYFTNKMEPPTPGKIYKNFTDTRRVEFKVVKDDFITKTYRMHWWLWIDGYIAASGIERNIKPGGDVERLKAKINYWANEHIPEMASGW